MSDVRSLIESACKGNVNDLRTLLLQFNDQFDLHNQATGTNWVDPTSGKQQPSTTPPPAASAAAKGANGNITVQITNPSQAAKATIYHEVSYSTVKNFSQNVTTLPVSAATSVNIPAPGQAPFMRIRSSYDGHTWNSHQLIQNTAVDAGLQTSAASSPAMVLNQSNFATVATEGTSGAIPIIRVYGPNGPYSGYTRVVGTKQLSRPSATILNSNFNVSQLVAFDGRRFHLSTTLPGIFNDSWEPVGEADVGGGSGGGGNFGGNGGRLTSSDSNPLMGDVEGETGSGGTTTVVGVNNAAVPESASYIGTNAIGQLIPAAAPSSANFVDDETVAGSGTAWTLAEIPEAGCVPVLMVPPFEEYAMFALVLGSTGPYGYTISGADITTMTSWPAGSMRAWYRY